LEKVKLRVELILIVSPEPIVRKKKNGEVCPANWSEGSDGMKADPSGSKEYFQKHN